MIANLGAEFRQDVDVVGHPADLQQHAVSLFDDAADVGVKVWLPLGRDRLPAILGRVDNVVQQVSKNAGH